MFGYFEIISKLRVVIKLSVGVGSSLTRHKYIFLIVGVRSSEMFGKASEIFRLYPAVT